jgi:short-subunit dehydrogenase
MPRSLITGAGSGIGAAFAERLAGRGHDLVLVARDGDRLQSLADDLSHRYGASCEVLPADLSDRDQVQQVCDRLAADDDPVDLLVNSAGFALARSFLKTTPTDEEGLLDVLVRSVLLLSHAGLPGMVERGRGGVINVASVAGWTPSGTYSAAKAWVIVFTEGLAAGLAETGVKATVTCPGYTRTEFHQRADIAMDWLPAWAWQEADQVADDALAAFAAGRVVTVPGIGYRAAAALARHAPSSLVQAAATRGARRRPR